MHASDSVTDRNKDAVLRLYAAFNSGDESVVDELFPDPQASLEFRHYWRLFREGFPDLHETVFCAVAEGDLVVIRSYFVGTHTGTFMGVPATGRRANASSFGMYRLDDGKIVEHWGEFDNLSLLQQIGVVDDLGVPLPPRH